MRRENRMKEKDNFKTLIYVSGSVLGLAIIAFVIAFTLYGNKIQDDATEFNTAKISDLVPNISVNSTGAEAASSQIGKTVEQSKNEINNNVVNDSTKSNTTTKENTTNKTASSTTSNKATNNTVENTNSANTIEEKEEQNPVKEEPKEKSEETPVFVKPVEGDILREFAKDKLIYSETLKEWTTHTGIDIKADKTSVVKTAADGRISTIKNDPRYGLTVTIEHSNGFKTVYANLLTAEFVTEGEEVKSGQTIGTVGTTATFEILDEAHLHFEILKDDENVDPTIYIK